MKNIYDCDDEPLDKPYSLSDISDSDPKETIHDLKEAYIEDKDYKIYEKISKVRAELLLLTDKEMTKIEAFNIINNFKINNKIPKIVSRKRFEVKFEESFLGQKNTSQTVIQARHSGFQSKIYF